MKPSSKSPSPLPEVLPEAPEVLPEAPALPEAPVPCLNLHSVLTCELYFDL